jgi:hypothetical protein
MLFVFFLLLQLLLISFIVSSGLLVLDQGLGLLGGDPQSLVQFGLPLFLLGFLSELLRGEGLLGKVLPLSALGFQ